MHLRTAFAKPGQHLDLIAIEIVRDRDRRSRSTADHHRAFALRIATHDPR
jgi:hypothetical protein